MLEVEDKLIKEDGLGLLTATFFLAGTMAGSGVLALPMAMVGTGLYIKTVVRSFLEKKSI